LRLAEVTINTKINKHTKTPIGSAIFIIRRIGLEVDITAGLAGLTETLSLMAFGFEPFLAAIGKG
jgi:hypothetical protein